MRPSFCREPLTDDSLDHAKTHTYLKSLLYFLTESIFLIIKINEKKHRNLNLFSTVFYEFQLSFFDRLHQTEISIFS